MSYRSHNPDKSVAIAEPATKFYNVNRPFRGENMTYVDSIHISGTKIYAHAYADTLPELERLAERLGAEVKIEVGDYVPHLDLSEHKRDLAIRYGAMEIEE